MDNVDEENFNLSQSQSSSLSYPLPNSSFFSPITPKGKNTKPTLGGGGAFGGGAESRGGVKTLRDIGEGLMSSRLHSDLNLRNLKLEESNEKLRDRISELQSEHSLKLSQLQSENTTLLLKVGSLENKILILELMGSKKIPHSPETNI